MATTVQPIPDNARGITPYLCVRNAARAIEFYKAAFGAQEVMRLVGPDGVIGHAELTIVGATIMLSDEFPDYGAIGPETLGGTPSTLHMYVNDVDTFVANAEAAGATITRPPVTEFYGDRSAKLTDPFGHTWSFASRVEEVSVEEMQRTYDAMMAGASE